MIDEREHVTFEALNDLADDRLDEQSARAVREHLVTCPVCASEHRRLLHVIDIAAAIPKAVLPPGDLWPGLKRTLESRKTLVLPNDRVGRLSAPHTTGNRARWWASGPALVAAALVLILLSSGITTLVLRRGTQVVTIPKGGPPPATAPVAIAPPMLPVDFRQTEVEYTRTIQELQMAVNAQRGRLSPQTVQTVEHSLAVIDSAIGEARNALLADPNNRVLIDLLSANYQRKLDLLRRASELGSRI